MNLDNKMNYYWLSLPTSLLFDLVSDNICMIFEQLMKQLKIYKEI